MKKTTLLKIIFACSVLFALAFTACQNGNGPERGGVIQNETLRDTVDHTQTPADNTAVDTTRHM